MAASLAKYLGLGAILTIFIAFLVFAPFGLTGIIPVIIIALLTMAGLMILVWFKTK